MKPQTTRTTRNSRRRKPRTFENKLSRFSVNNRIFTAHNTRKRNGLFAIGNNEHIAIERNLFAIKQR